MAATSLHDSVVRLGAETPVARSSRNLSHLTDAELETLEAVPQHDVRAYVDGLSDAAWLDLSRAVDRALAVAA